MKTLSLREASGLTILYSIVSLLSAACGGTYAPAPPLSDAGSDAPPTTLDASEPEAATPDAACFSMVCDPAIGWYDNCAQQVVGCPGGGADCCNVDGAIATCQCLGADDGTWMCGAAQAPDAESCLHCGGHCTSN